MAAFTATPFRGLGLPAVTSGSTFRATHRLPQSSNPDIPAIVVQSSMFSLVFPKQNPTTHGNDLSIYSANAVATTFPDRKKKDHRHTSIPITGVSRSGQHAVIRARPDRWYWRKSLVQRKSDKRSRERFPVINSGRLMLPLRLSGLPAFVEV